MIDKQIELEKQMTQLSIDSYRNELMEAKAKDNFANTKVASQILSRILETYVKAIEKYQATYYEGHPCTAGGAAIIISKFDIPTVAVVSAKVILNRLHSVNTIQTMYKAIGQALEDEYKMRSYKDKNIHYYTSIQDDLIKRGAKPNRIKNILTGVYKKKLDFYLDKWSVNEKMRVGLVLLNLFADSTGIIHLENIKTRRKQVRIIQPSDELMNWIEDINTHLEVMTPFFLPMVAPPKAWTGILDGGYLSPYIKRNKLIKNNDKSYLKKLAKTDLTSVYEAINHLQATGWQINNEVLRVVEELWNIGKAVAELPDREDIPLIPYPYPEKDTKNDSYTEEEIEVIKKWKRDTYEIYKTNIQKRSVRILVSQILRVARMFKDYDTIYFPYQMDFRGRIYPIPVLLQPQGSDLAKGLLRFSEGKKVDKDSIKWLQIHGANVYGYDKESYSNRIKWVLERHNEFKAYVENPLENRGWTEADKPFQFLAWCYEYVAYLNDPDNFETHIPIQLDGTCNGLQHYSALLRDEVGGKAVNLVNQDKPSDIYANVADKLQEKLLDIQKHSDNTEDIRLSKCWLDLGINRKLTKRPVMVLPYGGTRISCKGYIEEYLKDTYSSNYLWEYFKLGECPADCVYKAAGWLAKYLWAAITDTLKSAIVGMDYLRKLTRLVFKTGKYMEWTTPIGLLIRQSYPYRKRSYVKTELFGVVRFAYFNVENEKLLDKSRQVNGICPNFIHSLDATCLMIYLLKCKEAGINSVMSVHDCYGTLAPDCEKSARFLREAFIEIYRKPILETFTKEVIEDTDIELTELPELPSKGKLDIEKILESEYFFN